MKQKDFEAWQMVEARQWDRLQREHLAWLARGRIGPGRIELTHPDFLGADLHGLRFPGARLVGPRLTGASLAGADLSDTEITQGELTRAVLVYAGARRARWTDCDLTAASGDLSTFAGGTLTRCDWTAASLRRVSWAEAVVEGCTFDRADLTDVTWDGARVSGCSLRDATLARVEGRDFDPRGSAARTVFRECDLRGADLDRLRLSATRFERCQVGGVRGRPSLLGDVRFVDCDRGTDVPEVGSGGANWAGWE
ncbi:MAG: pentapeptide repeat-containing protein [Deltaproteobacteria bacterium]|nr:pentapeptide repeat-containing protein [Deltaproteobacteria bacterium]